MKNSKDKIKIEFLEDCLIIYKEILVVSDIHIGYEDQIYGKNISNEQYKETIDKFEEIFKNLDKKKIKIKQIVILGDLKHEFGIISDKEWKESLDLIDYLNKKIKINKKFKEKIVLIKGNHDTILGPIAKKRELEILNYYKYKNICFIHGHLKYENYLDNIKYLFLGHLHPSIVISDKYKKEKFKCFLKGKWENKEVMVLPSFCPISFGYDLREINKEYNKNKDFFIIPNKILGKLKVIIYNKLYKKEYEFLELDKLIKKLK